MNGGQMRIVPMEQYKPTTITLILSLTNGVNIDAAFHLLPITRIETSHIRESSKCKLPHCSIPGSILSMRYRGNVRGIIRNKASPFKNAITIDISTKVKNISLKLSQFSIQMCGASSREDGIEAATHVLNHLKKIQRMLDLLHQDPASASEMVQWIKTHTLGESVDRPCWENHEYRNVHLRVYSSTPDNSIVVPRFNPPDKFDLDVVKFLVSLGQDFQYHSDFCRKLDYIPTMVSIIDLPLEIDEVNEAMVNYNYSLGFEVDRSLLNQYIDGQHGFISRYNNALSPGVTIELPYTPLKNRAIKRRKNKIPHHTFLVYRSGSVTQSGPGGSLMKDAYYLFMNMISELYPYIQLNAVAVAE